MIQFFILGLAVGAGISFIISFLSNKNKLLRSHQKIEIQQIELEATKKRAELIELELASLREQNAREFETLANKILEEKSTKVAASNKDAIDAIVKPLRERIQLFEEKIDRNFLSESKDRNALLLELTRLNKLNTQLGEEASQLSGALRGNTKIQGDWGEMILESILEKSGLEKDIDFKTQHNITSDDGKHHRPDIIVNLPDQKHLIIDSKVSISAYTNYVNSEDSKSAEQWIAEHTRSLRTHIKQLSEKNYQKLAGINSPEFVLLFVPVEGAFSLALKSDTGIYEFAWDKNVVLVSPTTLLATLRTVASIWQQEKRIKNAESIALEAGKLYDKFVLFTEDLMDVSKRIDQAKIATDGAFNKLMHGNGNLISRAEKMKEMGAKTSKQLPEKLLGWFLLITAIFLASCSVSKNSTSNNSSVYYNDELSLFHPDIVVFHHSEDSSTFYFDIPTKELLYSRPKGMGAFEAHVEVSWLLKDVATGSIIDSSRITFDDVLNNFPEKFLSRNVKFPLPLTTAQLDITIKDKLRGFSTYQSIFLDKTNTNNYQNFRITSLRKNKVITTQEVSIGDSILIENWRSNKQVYCFYQKGETKLPPAPFSSTAVQLPEISDFKKLDLPTSTSPVVIQEGLYFFSTDTLTPLGLCLFSSVESFPTVKKMNQLHPPLRYLTTKAEFENITKSSYPKEKVDQFWLECGGEKERARELIKEYYQRVQEANRYFSTYTEGWRTDRGMIHLVFGHPNKISTSGNTETWLYGDEDSSASLRFTFKKLNSPWSPNIYILQRDPLFKNYWERMVSAWRSGRVYTY